MEGPIRISWVREEGRSYAVARSVNDNELINEILDYSIHLSRFRRLSSLTVESEIYHVSLFFKFMRGSGIPIYECDDAALLKFRDEDLRRLSKTGHHAAERVFRRTVNARLRRIYSFLLWYKEQDCSRKYLIGPSGCAVSCSLSESQQGARKYGRAAYPLLLACAGSSSRHRIAYESTDVHLKKLRSYFLRTCGAYAFHRNTMIMDVANILGFRRCSVNSLKCSDILKEFSKVNGGKLTPSRQKFGYMKEFDVPFSLLSELVQFIEGPRLRFIEHGGFSELVTEDRLFLSARNGRPLTDRAITDIFSDALRVIGVPRGSIHGIRRKYANEEIARETQLRLDVGLDTSVASVSAAVALKMGQSNPNSLHPYVSLTQQRLMADRVEGQQEKIRRLEAEVARLKAELKKDSL